MKSSSSIEVCCADGLVLAGSWFPAAEPRAAVLIAGAMGVRRRFYVPIARWFAEQGLSALVVDYRGIGDSPPGPNPALHDWGELDLSAALAELRARCPGVPLTWLGHSIGGQLFALMPAGAVSSAVFVGSQSGYWKNWDGWKRLGMWALWYLGIPLATLFTGRLPMKALGQGEDLPKGVAREWARWGRHPDYLRSYGGFREDAAIRRYDGPLTLYAILDDAYAPPRSVHALARFYGSAVVEEIDPGERGMGHFGPFWPSWSDTFWLRLRDRLLVTS